MIEESGLTPRWTVAEWLNTTPGFSLTHVRGRVVVAAAFQMLCPSCVSHTIPQLIRVADTLASQDVSVLGLHTVFEHHEVMNTTALRAFIHEYRVNFPVAVDLPDPTNGPVPVTMSRYAMGGTPTTLLFDQAGALRHQGLGHLPDLQLAAMVGSLLRETASSTEGAIHARPEPDPDADRADAMRCDDDGCRIPESRDAMV